MLMHWATWGFPASTSGVYMYIQSYINNAIRSVRFCSFASFSATHCSLSCGEILRCSVCHPVKCLCCFKPVTTVKGRIMSSLILRKYALCFWCIFCKCRDSFSRGYTVYHVYINLITRFYAICFAREKKTRNLIPHCWLCRLHKIMWPDLNPHPNLFVYRKKSYWQIWSLTLTFDFWRTLVNNSCWRKRHIVSQAYALPLACFQSW